MTSNQKRWLQASRGFAACLVLLFHVSAMSNKYFHYDFLGVSQIGRSGGVDYFFVLTGFLMAFLYGDQIGTRANVTSFLVKRLIRIYPLYWLITLVVLPVYFLFPHFGYGYETQKDTIFKSLLLLPQSHGPILPVAWSLSYFVLFYFMTALLMRIPKRWAIGIGVAWIAVSICNVLHVPIIGPDVQRHPYLSFLFNEAILEFAVGAGVANLLKRRSFRHTYSFLASGLAGFLFIWLNNKFLWLPFHDYLWYVIPSALLLSGVMSVKEDGPLPKWILALSKLGDASFSILLTHLLFVSILMKLLKASHAAYHIGFLSDALFVIICTIPLCRLVYEKVEKPLVYGLKNLILYRAKSQ